MERPARFRQVIGHVRAVVATNAVLHVKGAGHGESNTICRDGHARRTIAVAIAKGRANPRPLGTITNRPEAVRKIIDALDAPSGLRVCYETRPIARFLGVQANLDCKRGARMG
jgi:hypothetical protein